MLKIIYIYLKWEPLQIALNSLLQRWKEQYFVNVGTDCGLTIAGFYYICFSCSDGSISGFYYDPNSRCSPLLFPIGLLWSQFFSLNLSKLFISLMHVLIRSFSIFLLYLLKVFDMITHGPFAALTRSLSWNPPMMEDQVSVFHHMSYNRLWHLVCQDSSSNC